MTPSTLPADALFVCLRDVMIAGLKLSDAFQKRLPWHEANGLGLVALHAIESNGRRGLSQNELGACLGRSPSSVTRLLDAMEQNSLVFREPHPTDRRINLVQLTAEGRQLLQDLMSELSDAMAPNRDRLNDPQAFTAQLQTVSSYAEVVARRPI
jgi:DNA-binding MarR family transcriptional regulator